MKPEAISRGEKIVREHDYHLTLKGIGMQLRKALAFALIIQLLLGPSCATGLPKVTYLEPHSSAALQEISCTSRELEALAEDMERAGNELKKHRASLSARDYDDLLQKVTPIVEKYKKMMIARDMISKESCALFIAPRTKATFDLDTYCLSPFNAAPSENEPYILVNDNPSIALYPEIMRYTNTKERVSQSLKQLLLWNLKNKVKFEDLPFEQKALLLKVDRTAYIKVNSELKEYLKNGLTGFVRNYIPEDLADSYALIRGKTYDYQNYAHQIERMQSRFKKPSNDKPIKAKGHNIYAHVLVHGYAHATVTFINTSNECQRINSYFKPLREDIQPLGFDIPDSDEYFGGVRQAFGGLLNSIAGTLGYSFGPGDRLTFEKNPDRLLDLLKAYRDKARALERTRQQYGGNFEDDISDAFRHAYWNALMARDVGIDFAKEITDNHELNPGRKESRDMDLWNNQVGREIGQILKDQGIKDDESYAHEVLRQIGKLRKRR